MNRLFASLTLFVSLIGAQAASCAAPKNFEAEFRQAFEGLSREEQSQFMRQIDAIKEQEKIQFVGGKERKKVPFFCYGAQVGAVTMGIHAFTCKAPGHGKFTISSLNFELSVLLSVNVAAGYLDLEESYEGFYPLNGGYPIRLMAGAYWGAGASMISAGPIQLVAPGLGAVGHFSLNKTYGEDFNPDGLWFGGRLEMKKVP